MSGMKRLQCSAFSVRLLLSVLLPSMLAFSAWGREQPAPVIEAATQPGITADKAAQMENRIARLERQVDSQAMLEVMSRIESLREEIQRILGQVEEQANTIEGLQKRQRELYLDVDARLRKLEEGRSGAPAGVSPQGSLTPPATDSAATSAATSTSTSDSTQQLERKAYDQAFALLRDKQYDNSIAAFKAYLQTFPNGRYASNARYWLGEANYVERRFAEALAEFQLVVKDYPQSEKRPEAMLKIGYTLQELGDIEQARVILNDVIKKYPSTAAANLAKKRIAEFKQQQ